MTKDLLYLLSISALFTLFGCTLDDQMDVNETTEGRFLKLTNGQSILVNDQGIMVMENELNESEVCEDVTLGDKIAIITNAINQSDPASANVTSCTFLEEGALSELPNETLDRLQEMGWVVDQSE
ncbi:hypothetical protein ACI2JA_11030 [Alkalihalobacillus sp. NPDC078783]